MNFETLIKARKVLEPVWKKAQLKGRCWGLKRIDNPYSATNITFALGGELVSISQGKDGKLRIHEFSRTENTLLGKEVKEILKETGLSFEE